MSRSAHQTSYGLLCEALHEVLRAAVESGPGVAGGIGSVPCRAVATLYMLLMSHPIDRRGRCRSCRRAWTVFGRRWRRCRVYGEASVWLLQPAEFVGAQLARELGLAEPRPDGGAAREESADNAVSAADPDSTEVLPAIESAPGDPTGAASSQSPAVPPSASLPGGLPRAGRPDPDHGGAEAPTSTSPRPRRAPPDSPIHKGRSLVLTGGPTWQT